MEIRKEFDAIEQVAAAIEKLTRAQAQRVIGYVQGVVFEREEKEIRARLGEVSSQTELPLEEKKEEPKKTKKAKKPAAKKEEPKSETKAEAQKEEPKEEKKYTKSDISKAAQDVSKSVNIEKVKEILTKFEAVRISEVKKEDYAAFVEECEKAMA